MYNAEIKMQYIQYCLDNKNKRAEQFLPLFFGRTEPAEQKLDKDLCNFTMREITEMYKMMFLTSYSSIMNIHSHLRDYANLCNQRNLIVDGINHFNEVDTVALRNCLHEGITNDQVVTRAELLELLQMNEIRNAYEKVWILGTFEGLTSKGGDDLLYLKKDMIDFDYLVVQLPKSGRVLSISKELAQFMDEALSEDEYVTANGERTKRFKKVDPDILFKPPLNSKKDYAGSHVFRVMLLKYQQELELPYLNSHSLKESGAIHFIKSLMEQDGSDDPVATYRQHKKEVETRYGVLNLVYHFALYKNYYKQE